MTEPRSNNFRGCISSLKTPGDNTYLAYGCRSFVRVYSTSFKLLHLLKCESAESDDLLTEDDKVTAVAGSSSSGIIAASRGNFVFVFNPVQNVNGEDEWSLLTTLQHQSTINYLSWSEYDDLIVSGKSLQIFSLVSQDSTKNWESRWKIDMANSVEKAVFSPCGQMFASFGKNDRFVKIWTKSSGDFDEEDQELADLENENSFSFKTNTDNVLLTTCRDNFTRLWVEHGEDSGIFSLSVVIDPFLNSPNATLDTNSSGEVPIVHWFSYAEIMNVINNRVAKEGLLRKCIPESKDGKSNSMKQAKQLEERSKKLRDAVKEYSDFLFHITNEGTLILWGIQHLASHPRRISKLFTIMVAENCVPPQSYHHFQGNMVTFNRNAENKHAIVHHSELCFWSRTPLDGNLNCYVVDLHQIFTSSWSPKFQLIFSWFGHQYPVRAVVRHPNLPLMSSIDESGLCIIGERPSSSVSMWTNQELRYAGSFYTDKDITDGRIAWLPCNSSLVIQEKSELVVYGKKNSELYEKLLNLPSFNIGCDSLIFLHSYTDFPENQTNISIFKDDVQIYIVGVDGNENAYVWNVKVNGPEIISTQLLFKDKLNSDENITSSLVYCKRTDDLCNIYFPHASLGGHLFVTLSSDGRLRFWHFGQGGFRDVALSDQDQKWITVSENQIKQLPDIFETSSFGKIATAKYLESGNSEVVIYSHEVTGVDLREEWRTELADRIISLDWFVSSDGQHFLAVGTQTSIMVFCKRRKTGAGEKSLWFAIKRMNLEGSDVLVKICWLSFGSLFVATTTRVLIYNRWEGNFLNDESLDFTVPKNLFSVASNLNGRLPDHHPESHYDMVNYILSLIHVFIKRLAAANRKFSELPVPLWKITEYLFTEKSNPFSESKKNSYEELFADDTDYFTKEEDIGTFSQKQAEFLSDQLTRTSLPHISNADQLRLLALIDTVIQLQSQRRSLDENGARYLLAMRLFLFSQKVFPPYSRPTSLSTRDIAWAVYCESQDNLLDLCNQSFNGKMVWSDARALGMGYWITNVEVLKKQVEVIARTTYMGKDDKDPIECSLWYLAMRKKNVLLGLWRLAQNHPEQPMMVKFLANDFSEERWQKAALKNAFVLLGKQRYEYAAAFFLLGDRLKDAVNVCLKQLNDFQLAIVICRLYQGDQSEVLADLLNTLLSDSSKSEDRWACSIFFTLLNQKENALYATLMDLSTLTPGQSDSVVDSKSFDPDLLVLYNYLRKRMRLLRMDEKVSIPKDLEFDFVYRCASQYEELGLPALALEIVLSAPKPTPKASIKSDKNIVRLDSDAPKESKAEEIDWSFGSPEPKSEFKSSINWDEPVSHSKNDDLFPWDEPTTFKTTMLDDYDSFRKGFIQDEENLNVDLNEVNLEIGGELVEKVNEVELSENEPSSLDLFCKLVLRNIARYKWHLAKQIVQETLPLNGDLNSHIAVVSEFFYKECQVISHLAFSEEIWEKSNEINWLSSFSRRLLWAALRWRERLGDSPTALPTGLFSQTAVTAYLALIICCIKENQLSSLCWLIALGEKFSKAIFTDKLGELRLIFAEVLAEKEHRNVTDDREIDLELDSDEDFDSNASKTDLQRNRDILRLSALQYVLLVVDSHVAKLHELSTHEWYVGDLLYNRFSSTIKHYLKQKLNDRLDASQIDLKQSLLEDINERHLFEVLRSVSDIKYLVNLVLIPNLKTADDFSNGDSKHTTEFLFKINSIPSAFVLNPMDANRIAVCTPAEIIEIDVREEAKRIESSTNTTNKESVDDLNVHSKFDDTPTSPDDAPRVSRNLSFDSLQQLLKRRRSSGNVVYPNAHSSINDCEEDSQLHRAIPGMMSLEAHPTLNYYLAGMSDGANGYIVKLYQFGQRKEITTYNPSLPTVVAPNLPALNSPNIRITKCRFDLFGNRFAGVDSKGDLRLWRFDAQLTNLTPFATMDAHSFTANDVLFLNSGSLLATTGLSSNQQ
ncbi:regulator of (H+)-ATPase in vacuolar membrane [Nowakowskiella sp. JEL0407]|nr:regulator of (H+)-ATPase in vacuolar membrane [Nowakowskiella sp. JEL0407]